MAGALRVGDEFEQMAATAPDPRPGDIPRARLTASLRQRFEVRLVHLVGHAGFGKTTALARAVAENELQPEGIDVWVSLFDGDEPDAVLGRIMRGLGFADTNTSPTFQHVSEAIWVKAPADVCCIFDDMHRVAGTAVEELIAKLVAELPTNAHVVTSSRSSDPFVPSRRLAAGDVVIIDQDELSFTDAEIKTLSAQELDPGDAERDDEALRWPAQLALAQRGGRHEQIRYLREEVLAALSAERADALAAISLLGPCGDALLETLSLASTSVAEVVRDLPLVDRYETGEVQLHDLWGEALEGRLDAQTQLTLLAAAARFHLSHERHLAAIVLAAQAGDSELLRSAAIAHARLPTMNVNSTTTAEILRVLDASAFPTLRPLFEAVDRWDRSGPEAAWQGFEDAFAIARSAGDDEVAAIAAIRLTQAASDDDFALSGSFSDLFDELAGSESEVLTEFGFHYRAFAAMRRGDTDEVRRLLPSVDAAQSPILRNQGALLRVDIGWPEWVAPRPDLAEDFFGALATWLRGDVTPEDALLVADIMVASSSMAPVRTRFSLLGVVTAVAAAAGRHEKVAEYVNEMTEPGAHEGIGANVGSFGPVARAVQLLAVGDERGASQEFASALGASPIEPWPYRSYLLALGGLYLTRPETRKVIDQWELGPALTLAVQAAQALVAWRDHGDTTGATAIDWSATRLLRVHVTPPQLVELAVVASASGCHQATAVLAEVPDVASHLLRVAETSSGKVKREAKRLGGDFPARPKAINVRLFGEVQLVRDGAIVSTADWSRSRVKELLAWLVLHRQGPRDRIAEALWPDIDPEAARNNLRVHLSYLHGVLEPDRPKGAPPWFVRSDGDILTLHRELLTVDLDAFDAAFRQATEAERIGAPRSALTAYRAAVAVGDGPLLGSLGVVDWARFEVVGVRSRVVTAHVRVGELDLARGEPELALQAAAAAARIDPESERVARLFMRCLLGTGDVSGARSIGEQTVEVARSYDQRLEPETLRLLASIGVTV